MNRAQCRLKNENAGDDSAVKKMGKSARNSLTPQCWHLPPNNVDFRIITSDVDDLTKAALEYLAPVSPAGIAFPLGSNHADTS